MKLAEAKERIETLEVQVKAITAILTELQVALMDHTHTVTITSNAATVESSTKESETSNQKNNEDNK
jgi:uncharacterized coiled-coil protein SlyX